MKRKFKTNFKIKKDTYCRMCDEYHTHIVLENKDGFTVYICMNCYYRTGTYDYDYSCPKCHTESSISEYGDICLLGKDKCDKHCETIIKHWEFPTKIVKRPCETCEHYIKDTEEYSYVESKDYRHTYNSIACGDNWTEVHKCLHCGEIYEFENSSI